MALPEYQRPAQYRSDIGQWTTQIATFLTGVLRGRLNISGEVTLSQADESESDTSQTVVEDDRCHPFSVIHFDPLDNEAAAALYGGEIYVATADRAEGSFAITHPTYTDGVTRAFRYTITG
jgi:hypothetical protein